MQQSRGNYVKSAIMLQLQELQDPGPMVNGCGQ